ncbi:MAG: DNA methyltransferase [Pseudonocardia sp.]
MPGHPVGDVWTDLGGINSAAKERVGYDTQKPEALLERIIESSSDKGSIVLDCFVGSGTTPAVAERLGRRWVAVDIGRFAIHTTRKRLLDRAQCAPFVVANLGRYERQVWQRDTTGEQVQAYLDFVVTLYGATPVRDFRHVHGTVGAVAVHVGAVDAPVTLAEIKEALDEARTAGHPRLDVLGWEFEMGLNELVQDEARFRGITLQIRRIPREVMDPRVVASGEVVFHELAYLAVDTRVKKRAVTVELTDFVLPNPDLVPDTIRDKITSWSDYVDYWAVDFDSGAAGDGDTFHNQWQSYRTRADRSLELAAHHDYDEPGAHRVLVKVVDVFGNDTTSEVEVTVR